MPETTGPSGGRVPDELLAVSPNFRDLADAHPSLRDSVVYRSGHLGALDGPARAALAGLGVRAVYDLRTSAERRGAPNKLPVGTSVVLADVLADNPGGGAARLAAMPTTPGRPDVGAVNAMLGGGKGRDIMIDCYRDLVRLPSARSEYGSVLRGIASAQGAVAYHCTAGKDRTGWLSVVLLRVAGMPEEVVVADYLVSNEVTADVLDNVLRAFAEAGGEAEGLAHLVNVHPDYLLAADEQVAAEHGSFEDYLESGLGLSAQDIEGLRQRLRGR